MISHSGMASSEATTASSKNGYRASRPWSEMQRSSRPWLRSHRRARSTFSSACNPDQPPRWRGEAIRCDYILEYIGKAIITTADDTPVDTKNTPHVHVLNKYDCMHIREQGPLHNYANTTL